MLGLVCSACCVMAVQASEPASSDVEQSGVEQPGVDPSVIAQASAPLVLQLTVLNPRPNPAWPLLDDAKLEPLRPPPPPPPPVIIKKHLIESGDTLEKIFRQFDISYNDLHGVLQADEAYLVVDVIRPGSELIFEFSPEGAFQAMSLRPEINRLVTYRRQDDGFVYNETITPTEWKQHVVRADVKHSLYATILETGLSDRDAMEITNLLGNKVNFKRELRQGDMFDAVISDEYMGDQATGSRRLDAIKLTVRGKDHVAILFDDGNYYDDQGNSLTPALMRYPTKRRWRISSSFNPFRHHPITKRISPHNGTDFAAPIGTPVLATGDGIVTRVVKHAYAGLYVVIDNDGPFSTRFLHLSKALVKRGQRVSRGQKIALSGNSGRSTGAHLHYELHINGKPVNPMTAEIPTLVTVAKKDRDDFEQLVANYMPQLQRQAGLLDSGEG